MSASEKREAAAIHGERSVTSSPAERLRARSLLGDLPYHEIARQYGISKSAIGAIASGQNWSNLLQPNQEG
jgi:hypothetical protein